MQLNIGRDSFANSAICVIGTATARAVQEFGAAAALTVSDSTSEGTLREFVAHLGGESRVQSLRILIPRARVAREVLPEGLRRLGAIVDAFETYQSVKPNILPEDLARLFKERTIDAITFTSPSTISNFAELAGTKDLSQLLSTTVVACIGPTTARAAESFGLTHVIQPKVHNAAALVDSIVKTFDRA